MTEHHKIFLVNNFLFFILLVGSLIHGFDRWVVNSYFCLAIIFVLIYLVFKNGTLYKSLVTGSESVAFSLKTTARAIAWSGFISTVIIIGLGPLCSDSSYSVDKFSRVIGIGLLNDRSVSKISSHFYITFVLFFLLALNVYQNIRYALVNNHNQEIKKLVSFSDTLMFVGIACLLVCIYRLFLNHNDSDLIMYLVKGACLFLLPVFYLYETSRLQVKDIRTLVYIALLTIIVSVNIIVYFGITKPKYVFLIALSAGILLFTLNRQWLKADDRLLNSRLVVFSLFGALSLIVFSIFCEMINVLALRTDRFIDIKKISYVILFTFASLSVIAVFFSKRKIVLIRSRHLLDISVFLFVFGIALISYQPALVFGGDFNIYESANISVPVSDFFNFGKIPLFENFPGHGLGGLISSIAYGAVSGDYLGALFAPWSGWLYNAFFVLVLFAFIRKISNSFVAFCTSVPLPYVLGSFFSWGFGLAVLIPYIQYFKTNQNRHLILTVVLSVFFIAYRLDVGFSYLVGLLLSSLCVSLQCRNRTFFKVLAYYSVAGCVVLVLFLFVCLIKNINPILRVQEYLSIASSNIHWGGTRLGDPSKHAYLFFYFVMPVLSVFCLFLAIVKRSSLSRAEFATILALIFAYHANIPRIIVRHTIDELFSIYWIGFGMWTVPIALYLLISKLIHSNSSVILSLIIFILSVDVLCFPNTINYDNSVLQSALSRAATFHNEMRSDVRKKNASSVYRKGTRVVYNLPASIGLTYSDEIKAIADFLLNPDETYLDFTNQSVAYAWSGRMNPAYAVQSPSMLSGETSQRVFISEIEDLNNVPFVIMPADKGWYFTLQLDGINNNIRHYLVAEWIYNNYRPLIKYNDYSSVWALNSRYEQFHSRLKKAEDSAGAIHLSANAAYSQIHFIDWGYDNFVSLPHGIAPETKYISMAHDYNVEFLPFIWGQFDSRNAASNADLTSVSRNGSYYTWDYSGKEKRAAYLRVDLSVSNDFLKKTNASTLTLGNMERGKFTPLNVFRFKLKKGEQVYLFRISSDYYWSRGLLNALVLDPNLGGVAGSVRILEGD
jgi:hypothetical protein